MSDYLSQVRTAKMRHEEDVSQAFIAGIFTGVIGLFIVAGGIVLLRYILY